MIVAAINITGSTIHTFFGIPVGARDNNGENILLSDDKLIELKRRLGINSNNKMLIVILDEISMVTPQLLSAIDSRLRQATNVQQIFGGIPVVMFGDFAQLPPVKGASITDVVIKRAKDKITIERIKKNKEDPEKNQLPIYKSKLNIKKQKKDILHNKLQ